MALRGVVEVSGPDARGLLQRLITNDVEQLAPGQARYAALLTPQGKIIVDFLVVAAPALDEPERFLLDCPADLAADLARRLTLFKLRAVVAVRDLSAEWAAAPLAPGQAAPEHGLAFDDPRGTGLGQRVIGLRHVVDTLAEAPGNYLPRRIAAAIPEGGVDFAYGDTFPHEANLDRLNGVDFRKGCYVGQEVVSRMQHRGTARTRVTPVRFDGPAPEAGVAIMAGDLPVGAMGSSHGGIGLALLRTDRMADAMAAGMPIVAGAIRVTPA